MSTGAACYVEERKPGLWWCRVQEWPYGEWPEFLEYGPSKTPDGALALMYQENANPGGHQKIRYELYARIPCKSCGHDWHEDQSKCCVWKCTCTKAALLAAEGEK